ncbi:MAG TPA: sulfite exporter TauE/SafE family protein [Candidatus Desulfobacillus sp.]|nr:sulfite exporter TauE/SafE family protein [Candidatus Desulfobacillus sp.]
MPDTGYIAVFLVGLLGGTHCLAMCGGIVGALTAGLPPGRRQWPLYLAYNFGRISGYAISGAVLGAIGQAGLLLEGLLPVQMTLYVLANLLLIGLGLFLIGLPQGLAFLERGGLKFWARIQPLTRRFLPATSVARAYPLGLLWGFLPCGMVYSVLSMTLLTGSALRGAALMLAFGAGTLPNLLLAGYLLRRFRNIVQGRPLRLVSGLLVLGFGVWGLFNAAALGGRLWQGIVCAV